MPQAVKDISARKDYLKKCYKACLWSTACLLMCVLLFLMLDHLFPLKVEISYSQSIQDHQGNTIHLFLSKDQKWRIQASNNEISPLVKKVFIAKEDQYFYYHYGFNVLSIVRALVNNTLKRKTTSGASTITMQVSRLLVPKRRTYSNKLIEIFRAIQLENRYTKDEILNLYFNLIP
ncbi:MAG TPA: transglycosylase domain-containing protein, partial [Cytophagales bacterium]|nr:transglycosylase domain-containing protein [Cytophagales bacterium]